MKCKYVKWDRINTTKQYYYYYYSSVIVCSLAAVFSDKGLLWNDFCSTQHYINFISSI